MRPDTKYNTAFREKCAIQSPPRSVSLIVPIRDSEKHVEPLIDALSALMCDGLEIIVVDNDSRDATWSRLKVAGQQLNGRLHAIRESRIVSSYAARNEGICAAHGDILVFTDADCRPKPDWVLHLLQGFSSPGVGLVAGEIEAAPCTSWVERYSSRHRMLSQSHTLKHPYRGYAQTANLAVRRDVFGDVGMFRPNMVSGGDADLCWRAARKGWQLKYNPKAVVLHHHRSSLRPLWEQWYRYGRGQRHLSKLYGAAVLPASWRSVFVQYLAPYLPVAVRNMAGAIARGELSAVADIPLALFCWRAFAAGARQANFAGDACAPPELEHRAALR